MATAAKTKTISKGRTKGYAKEFCEFFAGIGLVREGLCDSGWRCTYANDVDPKKEAQYLARFGQEHFHLEDVKQTKKVLSEIPGNPFLATASFPCIDLSLAGHWRGFKGEHSSTFFAFTDVIKGMKGRQPKLIMLENVAGFLTSRNGEDFAAVVTSLAQLGYFVDSFVVDAKNFLPQSRVRVFVVGIHRSVVDSCDLVRSDGSASDPWNIAVRATPTLHPASLVRLMKSVSLSTGWVAVKAPEPPCIRPELQELIDTDDEQAWWDKAQVEKHFKMMSDLHQSDVKSRMRDKNAVHVGTIFRRRRNGEMRAEIRFDGVAGCLRVPRGGSARQIVIVIDKGKLRLRWMTPREYARLQGSPDFPLVGTANQQMAGFGDAVCVPVIRWIDQHVLTPLYEAVTKR